MNGLCKCGCGQVTPVAKMTRTKLGHVKGVHIDYCFAHALRGRKRSFTPEWKASISQSCKGRTPWNKGKKWPEEVLVKLRGKRDSIVGDKNPNWRGGIDIKIRGERRSRDYRILKRVVRERDKVCVLCGSEDQLQVDHIKSFTYYPLLRYDMDNVRLLCWDCHKATPNFGARARV